MSARDRLRPAAWRARSLLVRDAGGIDDARVIVGSGRSGTTWLQEVACRAGGLRPVFEPFDAAHDARFTPLTFGTCLPPDAIAPQARALVTPVLAGRYRSPWSDRLSPIDPLRARPGRVIKDIRILMWTGWLARQFPGVPIAYVIRHPQAVVRSVTSLGWHTNRWDLMEAQWDTFEDLGLPRRDALPPLDSPAALMLAMWCIENAVALRTLPPDRAHLVAYDQARREPELVEDMIDALGIVRVADPQISRPSHMTRTAAEKSRDPSGDLMPPEVWSGLLEAFDLAAAFAPDGEVDAAALHAGWQALHPEVRG